MVKAPSVAPAGGPAGVRRIHPGPEIAMNPRNLPTASASMPRAMRGDANAVGGTSATKTVTHIYGPYIRQVPALPVGAEKGSTGIAAAAAAGVGWIYTASSGAIYANCTDLEVDATGKKYKDY